MSGKAIGLAVIVGLGAFVSTTHAAQNLAAGAPEINESGSWTGNYPAGNPGTPNDTSSFGGVNITNGGDSTPASQGLNAAGYVPVVENTSGDGTFWLPQQAPNGANPPLGFVNIDLGSTHQIGEIDLYDTHNGQYNDRGTQNFHIDASNQVDSNGNLVSPTTILSGTLTQDNVYGTNDIAPDIFNASGNSLGSYRYLSFVADTAFSSTYNGGYSAGLNEIRVFEGSAVPEPATLTVLGLMSVGMLRRRRA